MMNQNARPLIRPRLAAIVLAIGLVACGENRTVEIESTEPDGGPLLSDPALLVSPAVGSTARPQVTSGPEVAWVSLPPGSVPGGLTASIRNLRTVATIWVALVDGGFDPVAIAAQAGDTLAIDVRDSDGNLTPFELKVPPSRRPVIVRTNPPPRKRDVPLNTIVTVVFSEPIDSQSLTASAVAVFHETESVGGQLAFTGADQVGVSFIPTAQLQPNTDYTLVITPAIRDLDGETLAETVVVPFSTLAGIANEVSFSDGPSVQLLNVDDLSVRTLATVTGFPGPVHWSWDGRRATFSNYTASDTTWRITVVDVEGSGPSTIIASNSQHSFPSWSRDGSRIAFLRELQIYTMNVDGTGVTQVTHEPPIPSSPQWSPDGTRIAFLSSGDYQLWTIRPDGTGLTRVTPPNLYVNWYAWSPDGSRFAVAYGANVPETHMSVINVDGSGVMRLVTGGGGRPTPTPSWSPDGSRLAFSHPFDGQTDLYTMNVDGSGLNRLTNDARLEQMVRWSPDGTRIVFTRMGAGTFIINADGSELRQLATKALTRLEWRPRGPGTP